METVRFLFTKKYQFSMRSVGIIGGGFSGTMTAIHLLRNATEPVKVFVYDKKHFFNKGIAYNPYSSVHLLNVPSAKMSAFANEPDHFLKWLVKHDEYSQIDKEVLAKSFMPRFVYGNYLEDVW